MISRIVVLDPLRLLAALAVLLYHYTFRGAAADGFTVVSLPWAAGVTKYGYLGVHLFFIISGFIIAASANGRTAREFAWARFARIYPGFLICMTATALLSQVGGGVNLLQYAANLIIDAPALGHEYVDGVYWTLIIEITFYLWIAALIAFGGINRILPVVIVWLAISLGNELILKSYRLGLIFLTGQSGFFALGLCLHELHRKRNMRLACSVLAFALFVAILQATAEAPGLSAYYKTEFSRLVITGIVIGCTVLASSVLVIKSLPLSNAALVAIGGVTYPLYLLHQNIGYTLLNLGAAHVSPEMLIALVTVAMLAASWIVWRFAEKPAQHLLKSLRPQKDRDAKTSTPVCDLERPASPPP